MLLAALFQWLGRSTTVLQIINFQLPMFCIQPATCNLSACEAFAFMTMWKSSTSTVSPTAPLKHATFLSPTCSYGGTNWCTCDAVCGRTTVLTISVRQTLRAWSSWTKLYATREILSCFSALQGSCRVCSVAELRRSVEPRANSVSDLPND